MYSDNYCRITIFGWDAFDDFNANFKRKFMIKSFCFFAIYNRFEREILKIVFNTFFFIFFKTV